MNQSDSYFLSIFYVSKIW